MATTREVDLVNSQVAEMFSKMEPRHIALLIAKIMQPDSSLTDLAAELWPDIQYSRRKQVIAASNVMKVLGIVRDRPWVMAAIMANKLAPVMTAVLYDLAMSADRDNVKATAAKELIRLAQSTVRTLAPSDDEPMPTEEQDSLLNEGQAPEAEEEADIAAPAVPTADELRDS